LAKELDHRDAADRFGILESEENSRARPLVGTPGRDVLAAQEDLAGGDDVTGVAHHYVGERRFAGSVGSHECVHFSFVHHEVNAAQDARSFGLAMKVSQF
jgi:hypothetical protein